MAEFKSDELIATIETWFKKAPELPANIREVLVRIAPWLALIFGALGVLAGLSLLGLSPVAAISGVKTSSLLLISSVFALVSSVLLLLAFPKLRKGELRGWKLLFWSEVVSVVSSILSLTTVNILVTVLVTLIAFYLLFQIKPYYKK